MAERWWPINHFCKIGNVPSVSGASSTYGYQKIDPSINPYANAVYQAYGPMRARLNPFDPCGSPLCGTPLPFNLQQMDGRNSVLLVRQHSGPEVSGRNHPDAQAAKCIW